MLPSNQRIRIPTVMIMAPISFAIAMTLGGCGFLFGGAAEEPTPTPAEVRPVVPTFTPTPVTEAPPPTPEPAEEVPTLVIALDLEAAPPAEAAAETAADAGVTEAAEPTATPQPKLTVKEDAVNVRLGPGTSYGVAGTANLGQEFTIVGSNAEKTWWLICCVNGKEAWVFGELTNRENDQFAQVVSDIPAAPQPVAQAPAQQPAAQPAPAEPTATPEPPPPPPVADPCAGIGGDGCKFKLRGGPSFGANGGTELKLVLHFIHSGIDGGQPQGSYFVWLEKDGVKLPVSDGVRSQLVDQQSGQGKYNYEFKIGIGDIPGNTVAGNYVIWVLDGNGERDSQTFTFTVPEGQGEVWMQFDQG